MIDDLLCWTTALKTASNLTTRKHRVTPFVGTDLETLLRANGIDTLGLAGVHTSGVVLSTVRHAGDLDYRSIVARDCCADPDAAVHAMLLDIVIAKQAAAPRNTALRLPPPSRTAGSCCIPPALT